MIRGFCKMIKNLYVILSCFLNGKETELILSRLLSWLFSCVDDARWVRGLEPFTDGLNPPQAAAVGKPPSVWTRGFCKEKALQDLNLQGLSGGLYWTRTSDPIDVNDVLYQLSQQTKSLGTKDSIA